MTDASADDLYGNELPLVNDEEDLPPEEPFEGEDASDEALSEASDAEGEGVLDRLRGSGVGTEDPNIVGDAGPTDVPPGPDPPRPDPFS